MVSSIRDNVGDDKVIFTAMEAGSSDTEDGEDV